MYNYHPPPQQQQHRSFPYQPPPLLSASGQMAPSEAPPSSSSSSSSFHHHHQHSTSDMYEGGKRGSDSGGPSSKGGGGTSDEGEAYVSRTLYICKLPPEFSEDEIRQACRPFGDIKGIMSYQSRQIAFVEYWDIRNAQAARAGLKNLRIGGRFVEVQYSKTQNEKVKERNTGTLYVRPVTTERFFHDPNTLQQYKDLFQKFGDVKKVNTNRKRDAEKFVEFHDLRAAEAAQESLNDMDFNGVKLEVQFANTQSKTVNKEIGAELHPPHRPRFRRDGSSPPSAYAPIRSSGFSDVPTGSSALSRSLTPPPQQHHPPLFPPSSFDPSSASSSSLVPGYQGLSIKLHWEGKFGPSATLGSQAPSLGLGQIGDGSHW